MKPREREMFERKDYYSSLLSFYGELLPQVTYQRMVQFYLEDLSITEISQNQNVSRNAVFESIKSGEVRLDEYEKMLKMKKQRDETLKRIDEVLSAKDKDEIRYLLNQWKGELENGI